MDRRAAGALLALAACFACSAAAPTASNQTALDLYEGAPEGCYYNFQHYGEGDRIMTNEPCLNCTCHNRMLMCYLRVCPFTKAIGQDCTVEKRADQCCPIVTCPDVPVDLLTSTSTTSPAEYGATGLGKLDKYGCSINGKYFPEGSKVPPTPNKPCEHCYCIRNMTTCVMQECTLHVDGCTPIYHKDVCCPVRYSCDHPEDEVPLLDDMSTTVRPTPGFLLTTTTISPVTQMTQDCVHDDRVFSDGALIKTEKACEHCYCMKGDIVCVVQECGAPMENEGKNCTSLPPREGQCCPDTYICEGDELTSELPTESTTESIVEKLTTLSPPRRTSVEGSGYRNEPDEAPYTDMPMKEPDFEGSGDEEESSKPLRPSEIIPTPGDDDQYIYVTTKGPAEHEEHEKTTAAADTDIIPDIKDKTVEPHISTIATPTSDVEEKVTTTRVPETYESVTTELEDAQNTVPDIISDEEVAKPIEYTPSTTVAPSSESESQKPIGGEDDKQMSSQEGQDVTMSATSKPEYSTTSSSDLEEIEKETATPSDISYITPEVVTEKEYSDGDITKTTSATSVEESAAEQDKETSKPELLAPSTTISPAEEDKESSKPEELAPGSTISPVQEEKESAESEKLTPITSSPLEEDEKLTTEPDHAQNTVAISEEDDSHPHSHIPTTTVSPAVDEESTTVFNQEQNVVTEKEIKEDVLVPIDHATTAVSAEKDEFTTAEPDRGLNTIPSEIYEESSSEPSLPGRTTLSEETKETEASAITDEIQTQGVEIKSTTVSELTTPQPEIIFTKGDQFTVTTEPSFRKEDEGTVSTEKQKEIEPTTVKSEFVDEGLIPTSPHEDKIGESSDAPTSEEEFTTLIPEYITEITDTIGSKQTTTEENKETSFITEISPEKVTKPSSEQESDLPSSTEKMTEITPLIETHEEPSRIPGEGDCLLNGVTYKNNTVVPSTNNCHTGCRCASSIIKCDPIICSPPPDYMENCQSIYDSPDSCCPTFVCDHPRETAPPQSDNQMSGTESPMPSPTIECRGDQCEISEPTKQPLGPSEPCTSDKCLTADEHKIESECGSDGCGDFPQKPDTSIPSVEHIEDCSGGNCKPEGQAPQTQVSPVTPCEGEHCKKTDEVVPELPKQCKDGEDCKTSEIPTSETVLCEGDSCNKVDCGVDGCGSDVIPSPPDHQIESCKEEDGCKTQEIPIPECTGDEPCRRKETSTSDAKPSTPCEGSNCVSEKETTVSQGVVDLSTELPKTEQLPSEEEISPVEPEADISKPESEKIPVKDTQGMDSYTTEGQTAKEVTKTDIHEEQPVIEDETKMPVIMEEKDKEKPTSEEEITLKPTMVEKEGTETPDVIEEETTKPAILEEEGEEKPVTDKEKGTEPPIIIDDKITHEPTLVDDEGKEKPEVSEQESTEQPIIDSDEGTKKPATLEQEKPVIDKESTNEPTTTDESDKQKPVIDVETTKEPTFIDGDDKQKPVGEENTPETVDQGDKEIPVVDEVSTKEPTIIVEDDKEKPSIVEESTKQPAMVDVGDEEKPTIDEESTKQPATVDEDEKEKPAVDEERTNAPETVDVEVTTKSIATEEEVATVPSTGEKATDVPVIIDQASTVVSVVADEHTEKPSFIDDDVRDKPVETEQDKTDKPTITEDDTEKPLTVDKEEKPLDVDVSDTDKTGQEPMTEKPDLTEIEGTDKPALEEGTTENLNVIKEKTTEKAVKTDEDGKEKPGYGEDEFTEKPMDIDENGTDKTVIIDEEKPAVFEHGDTEKPIDFDKESTEKPSVDDDNKIAPAVPEHESTEKSITSDVPMTDKSPEIEEENKDKPDFSEGSTAGPDIVDEEKSSEKPDIDQGAEDKNTEKPASVDADDKNIPTVVEMESTKKPTDIEKEFTELPVEISEETTRKPISEDDTKKPFVIEEESTSIPEISEEEGTAKPVIIDEGTEEPTFIVKEDSMKPAVIEREGTELPTIDGEESTEKPSVSDEETKEKHDLANQEGTKKPVIGEEGTEEPVVPEDGTEEPSIFEKESSEKPALIDEDSKVKPIDEDDSKKPILVEDKDQEKPIVDKDEDKPLIIDEEVTDKPAVNEVVSTEEGSGTESPETSHTTESEKDVKSPEIIGGPTEATITEVDKTSKTPYSESQTTISQDVFTSPQPETKVTEVEDSYSKEPAVEDHSRTPEIATEPLPEQEITTKMPALDQEKVTISEQDNEITTDVKDEGSTGGQDSISEEPEFITKAPEQHKISEPVELTTEKGIGEQEEVSTDASEIESPTTKATGADTVDIEPQEGIEPGKPDLHVTSKLEEEATTKLYEGDKIKPVPESHGTVAYSTSAGYDAVTDVPEITDELKPKPELPESQTDHPESHSSEKEEIITETPEYSVTEPIRRFTEIEDPSVTGQDTATGYSEETTEHPRPSATEKIDESSDVSITISEKPILPEMESELPEKSTGSDKPVTKMPEYPTIEVDKEKTTDKLDSSATEAPISDVTESQQVSDRTEKDVTTYEETATTISDLSDDKNIVTTMPTGYTEKQEPGMEITQQHVSTTEDANKATRPNVIEPQVTESQETSTKLVEQEKEGEAETNAPEKMYTESYDADKKEPSVTETQKVSTDLPIEDVQTEMPGVPVSSEVPQSLVTEQKESLGEQTTVSSIPEEESSFKPELPTAQSEEITKAPETHGQEEIRTEAPVHETEPVEISTKETVQEEKTHVSEDVTEKQYTATTLREPPVMTEETEQTELMKSTEDTSAQTEVSETTPYLIELEEHTHKVAKEPTTVSPSAEEHSYTPVEDTSTSSPSEEELSEKPLEDISTESPSKEEHSQKPVEDISTPYPSAEEHSYKPIDEISTSSPTEGEDLHKPIDDHSTSAPSEEDDSHKPVEDISTSSPSEENYTPKIEEHISTVSPIHEKLTTVEPDVGEEPQVYEVTTKKPDEEMETATKLAEGITKPSEASLPEDVSEKISESIPVEETTSAIIHSEEDKDTADHKEFTTAAPSRITEETTPFVATESEKLPTSESDIAIPTEQEVPSSEKPSHPIVSHETTMPEEEFISSTTKATTISQGEDIATPVPDAKPEEKPSETSEVPPSSTTTEASKPSIPDLQPTDEIPVPDDDGHFPPSGTGYGEPDYVEEDQAFGPGTCRYGGKVYVSAQQIPRDDPCDFCFCFRSDIICLQQSCPPPIHGCHEEPIQGFCCPRYECPVSMATTVNVTTTTTTTTTTLPPHFPTHSYKGQAQRRGCQIKGHTYKVGEVVRSSSGPCLHCTCGGDGQMKCDPKACTPEPMLRQMIAAAVSAKRRR